MKKKTRVPKTRGGGRYTEAGFRSFIRSQLRRMSQRWPPIYQALHNAKRPVEEADVAKWGKRIKFVYQCEQCRGWFPRTHIEADHIIPCGSIQDIAKDAGPFILRMLCEEDGIRPLCHECHQKITNPQVYE